MAVLMRELSAAISSSKRKTDSQTSASINVLLSVNAATSNWLRRASISSTGPNTGTGKPELSSQDLAAMLGSESTK
jgi:hypothetical protein